jgi:hypothetical protein
MCVCIHVYIAYTYICVYVHMYACIPTTCFPHNFFLRVPRCRAPGAVGCIGLDLTSIYVQEKKEKENNLVILLLYMYTYDPTYTYPKCILLIVNSLRVPYSCRAKKK